MSAPPALWTSAEIAAATGGTASAPFEVDGVTFDSREVRAGDLFVALRGEQTDGHCFVADALARGAAAALVAEPIDGPHVMVADTAAALDALARAARQRSQARIAGVTGSVGKTSTKEALYAALDRGARGRVHRSLKSYNNHVGVPLSLARMPRDASFAVFEMGMNHAGEIAALTRLVRPHVALVTTIAAAHIENLGSIGAIADAKGEIFEGLEPDGVAILPNESPQRDRLLAKARRHADRIILFGGEDGDVRALHSAASSGGGSLLTAALLGSQLTFTISQRGEHWIANSLAVLAAVEAMGADVAAAGLALADLVGLKGRGQRHLVSLAKGEALLIDESYNANPASMAATLASFGSEPVAGRRVAVLGTMRELGEHGEALHAGLAPAVSAAKVDILILLGEETRPLEQALAGKLRVERAADVEDATKRLTALLAPGDAVLVKASNSIGLARLVETVAGGGASCSI